MRINLSVNNISYSGLKDKKISEKNQDVPKEHLDVSPLKYTPDYNIKLPQKYTKIRQVNLPNDLDAQIYKLESGQKVVIVRKEGPTVIKTYVNTGALNEDDSVRGISHFVEHSLFNGSEGLEKGEFFEAVNKMGANTNASTGFSATDYYIKSNLLNKEDLEKQIKIHSAMLETPKFIPDMIEKEKGPVTSEISMILDDAENVAINTTIKNLFDINTTSKDIIGGTIDNIQNLQRDKVLNYYKQNYYPANMVTVVTGDVDEKNVISLVSKYMHSKTKPVEDRKFEELKPLEKSVRVDIVSDKTPSGFISIGLQGPENNNVKEKVIFDAINYLLTVSSFSRINKNLEDLQSSASLNLERVSADLKDKSAILISANVDDKNIDKALSIINSAIDELETVPPSKDEIEAIKKNLKFDFENKFEDSFDINSIVGGAMLDGDLSVITDYEKYIDELKPEDFTEFAKKYFTSDKEALTVIHPAKTGNISFSGRKPVDTKNVSVNVLNNNINLLENKTGKNVVWVDIKLTTDNIKPKDVGTSLVLSGLLEHGTSMKTKEDFFGNAEKNGIMLGFSASGNSIASSSAFMKQDTKQALSSIKEVLLSPRFEEKDFLEVKKQIIQDLKDTQINAKDILYEEIFKNLSKGLSKAELIEQINNTSIDDVKTLYKDIITNSQAYVAVSGPFEDKNFKSELESALSADFPLFLKSEKVDKKTFTPVENVKVITKPYNKSQAEIMAGYKFNIKDNSPEKMARYTLLNIILGGTASSRLFEDLRETQKLAYHVRSYLDYNDDDTGVCSLFIKTTADDKDSYKNIEKSINGFNNHVKKLLKENVSEEELENAKLVFKNRIFNDNETTESKNASLLTDLQSKFGIERTNEIIDFIDKITVDDIHDAAVEIFSSNPVYAVAAKQKALNENTYFLKNLED